MAQTAIAQRVTLFHKVAGGFILIPEGEILAVAGGGASISRIRTWLARHEIIARRAAGKYPAPDDVTFFRELRNFGIRGWRAALEWVSSREPVAGGRMVPVPRRLIRRIVAGVGRVQAITALAAAMRCLYVRGKRLNLSGTISVKWIAESFGVSPRAVASARAALVRSGWLRRVRTPRWHRQRYGDSFEIDAAHDFCNICMEPVAKTCNNCLSSKQQPLRGTQPQPKRTPPEDGRRRPRLAVAHCELTDAEKAIDRICRALAVEGGGRFDPARAAIMAGNELGRFVGIDEISALLRKREQWARRGGRPAARATVAKIRPHDFSSPQSVGALHASGVKRGWFADSEASLVRAFIHAARVSRLIRANRATPALWVYAMQRDDDVGASAADVANGQRMLRAFLAAGGLENIA